jgi:hypothetical protein
MLLLLSTADDGYLLQDLVSLSPHYERGCSVHLHARSGTGGARNMLDVRAAYAREACCCPRQAGSTPGMGSVPEGGKYTPAKSNRPARSVDGLGCCDALRPSRVLNV